jgi:O-antigen/teichoic acid export membrane protein
VRRVLRQVNFTGELFSSTFTYAVGSAIRLGSSLILTRLLAPDAYGMFGILLSFLFTLEMISDVGTTGLLIRHQRGADTKFVHTVWTVRLIRSVGNGVILFLAAPVIARIYNVPELVGAFRVLSIWFLLFGAESMSFILAQRDQKARISNYMDLASSAVMTAFVIVAAARLHSYYALVYGFLVQRLFLAISSHFFYRNIGVGIAFDREALVDQFKFARFVLPSSVLTLVLSQYDKLVLLKFFDLTVLGVYGLAQNMLGPVSGVIVRNARVVLYARCSHYFREDREAVRGRYYSENHKLMLVGVLMPAVLAGSAEFLVRILYDPRYAAAGSILQIQSIGAVISAFLNASENVLVASGKTNMVLRGNIFRVCTVIPSTVLGFYVFGLAGFLWFGVAAALPLLGYFYYEQSQCGLLNLRRESALLGWALIAFACAYLVSHVLMNAVPPDLIHATLKRLRAS